MGKRISSGLKWFSMGVIFTGTVFGILEKIFEPNTLQFGPTKYPWLPWVYWGMILLGIILMIADEIIRHRRKG
jgi:hypothetical protein